MDVRELERYRRPYGYSKEKKMAGILSKIQDTVIKYADIISKIAHVDVEVVDSDLYRVAGTGMFENCINQDMSAEGYVYRNLMRTGIRQVIYNPGKDPLCRDCPKRDNCKEEIEISMPLSLGEEIIGAIGLVGSSREQKDLILSDEKVYLELLSQIAEFIEAKATEVIEKRHRESMLSALECTMDHMEQGVLIIGTDGAVTAANPAAKKQLGIRRPEGLPVRIQETGDKLNNQMEYQLFLQDKSIFVLGNEYKLVNITKRYCSVFTFTNRKELNKKLYQMTATVNDSSIIGNSEKTRALREEIAKVANSTSTVLITGESGTGKEMVATSIWRAGDRRDKQFVAINCAAIPETLLESELFGYVKGAFTGADPNGRIGKFELANHGVIFLDEIGDMPLYLQVKLLRVLQERTIMRIGSNRLVPIDVRVIAATNKDLKAMMNANKFREDLYYRLNVIPLKVAPLRERREDIRDLAYFFADRYAGLFGKTDYTIGEDAMRVLLNHPWYGNVRELENTIEFMVNMVDESGAMDVDTMPEDFFNREEQPEKNTEAAESSVTPLKELERQEIQKALRLYGNHTKGKKQAAASLGIGLATLYRKLEEFS